MVFNILRNEIRKSSLSEIQRKLRYFPNISNNFPRENPRNPFLEHVFIRFSVNRWQKICIFFTVRLSDFQWRNNLDEGPSIYSGRLQYLPASLISQTEIGSYYLRNRKNMIAMTHGLLKIHCAIHERFCIIRNIYPEVSWCVTLLEILQNFEEYLWQGLFCSKFVSWNLSPYQIGYQKKKDSKYYMIREANTLDNYAFCYYAVDSLI